MNEAPLAGCTGEGILTHHIFDESHFSVIVMAIKSDEIRFKNIIVENLGADPESCGRKIGEAFTEEDLKYGKALFLFPDCSKLNFDRLHDGLKSSINPPNFLPLLGGTSGDSWEFKRIHQYHNDSILSDSVTAVLMSGDCEIVSAFDHGCLPIGESLTITKCENNIIQEIDNKPALDVFKEYLEGEEFENLQKAFAHVTIGFKTESAEKQDDDQMYIRYIPSTNEEAGSVEIPTEVKVGQSLWFTRRDHERVLNGMKDIADDMSKKLAGRKPKLMFQFECAGRGKMLFRESEVVATQDELQSNFNESLPWIGFFVYGEIAPVEEENCFHNYTTVLAAVV
ncbi:MAG: FIST C-terminal domain-containing protein [Pseudobacteriovorax sp.]|nr:FIST C-terminal domain-containing protein [Pseudobacteriovorax sp.]